MYQYELRSHYRVLFTLSLSDIHHSLRSVMTVVKGYVVIRPACFDVICNSSPRLHRLSTC